MLTLAVMLALWARQARESSRLLRRGFARPTGPIWARRCADYWWRRRRSQSCSRSARRSADASSCGPARRWRALPKYVAGRNPHRDNRGGVLPRLHAGRDGRGLRPHRARWWRARRSMPSRIWCARPRASTWPGFDAAAGFHNLLREPRATGPSRRGTMPALVGLFLLGLGAGRGVPGDRQRLLLGRAPRAAW